MPVPTRPLESRSYERAQFATTARLLSCLVTESLSRAFYKPLHNIPGVHGCAIILRSERSLDAVPFSPDSILALVPLHHPPIFRQDGVDVVGKEIGLLDPLDMIPSIFEVGLAQSTSDGIPTNVKVAISLF